MSTTNIVTPSAADKSVAQKRGPKPKTKPDQAVLVSQLETALADLQRYEEPLNKRREAAEQEYENAVKAAAKTRKETLKNIDDDTEAARLRNVAVGLASQLEKAYGPIQVINGEQMFIKSAGRLDFRVLGHAPVTETTESEEQAA